MASSMPEESYGYEERRFEKEVDENFHCSICYNVLKEPRMCRNNEHIFCLACITRSLNVNAQTCPECSEYLTVDTLRRAPRVVNNYLSELKIKCDYVNRGCPEFVRLEALDTHVENCGFAPVLCSNEECGMEINKQDKAHHETAVCEYRKLKCHNCGQIQESLIRLEGNLMEMNKKVIQKEEALKESIKQDFIKLDNDVAELKVMMGQMLEKFNNLERMDELPSTVGLRRHGFLPMPPPPPFFMPYPGPPPPRPTRTAGLARNNLQPLNPEVLAQASAADQKLMLGERLFPLIQQTHPDLAGKITGMLLEIDNAELLHMLEFRDALAAKVEEAVSVLHAHQERQQDITHGQR